MSTQKKQPCRKKEYQKISFDVNLYLIKRKISIEFRFFRIIRQFVLEQFFVQ